jgi:hypothetical protein
MASLRPNRQQRLRHFLLNLFAFSVCYLLANALAQQRAITRHLVFAFETHIPFLPWMIIPYLSSGIFFCLAFWRAGSIDQLRLLSQRMLLATVVASLFFVALPLQFSWPRPPITSPLPRALFGFLSLLDLPYNQLPSLHVAYCVIFWQALRTSLAARWARFALAVWLLLTAAATLFTFQHHASDVVAGLLLGLVCIRIVRPAQHEPQVAFYYLMAAGIVLIAGVRAWPSVVALYLMASALLVSQAYFRRDRHFLGKEQGRHSLRAWLLYAPYLIGYRFTWHAVAWRERHKPAFVAVTTRLLVGRRLNAGEACQLPLDCTIIDLAAELSETPALRAHRYQYFALLDLVTPPPAVLNEIVVAIDDELSAGRTVYLHCAMGYSRCILLANSYLAHIKQ